MNMQNIKDIAKDMGIKVSKMKKSDLIHSIQLVEGNFDCFSSAIDGECDQAGCIWRKDCFAEAKKKITVQ